MFSAMPTHKIKSTECGEAHLADDFRTLWGSVDCAKCLARRPPLADPRVHKGPHLCRECFAAESTCHFCSRCDEHCLAKAPRDEAAHTRYWAERPAPTVKRKRR